MNILEGLNQQWIQERHEMQSANDLFILNLKVIDGQPNAAGNRLLAVFDLIRAGIKMEGCVLIERGRGDIVAHAPSGISRSGHKAITSFSDQDLARAVLSQALQVYSALTGRRATVSEGAGGWS